MYIWVLFITILLCYLLQFLFAFNIPHCFIWFAFIQCIADDISVCEKVYSRGANEQSANIDHTECGYEFSFLFFAAWRPLNYSSLKKKSKHLKLFGITTYEPLIGWKLSPFSFFGEVLSILILFSGDYSWRFLINWSCSNMEMVMVTSSCRTINSLKTSKIMEKYGIHLKQSRDRLYTI